MLEYEEMLGQKGCDRTNVEKKSKKIVKMRDSVTQKMNLNFLFVNIDFVQNVMLIQQNQDTAGSHMNFETFHLKWHSRELRIVLW